MSQVDAIVDAARKRVQEAASGSVVMRCTSLELLLKEIDELRSAVRIPHENAVGKFHSKAGETERDAALAVYPNSGTQRERVLRVIANASHGLTDHEICQVTQLNPNTERPRRVELMQGDWIKDSGFRRQTGDGGDGIVWVVTVKTQVVLGHQTS